LTALWSSDLLTLWHGIARTIVPPLLNTNGKRKRKVIRNLLVIFLMTLFPFILLPYSFGIARAPDSNSTLYNYRVDNSSFILDQSSKLLDQIHFMILLLNLSACIGLFAGSSAKAWGFKISLVYAIISPLGAAFLVVAYVTNIILSLMMQIKKMDSR
ncbi:MAG: hypothetical protein WAL66_01530, partial [Nitrososphaeraceae archaeon]